MTAFTPSDHPSSTETQRGLARYLEEVLKRRMNLSNPQYAQWG